MFKSAMSTLLNVLDNKILVKIIIEIAGVAIRNHVYLVPIEVHFQISILINLEYLIVICFSLGEDISLTLDTHPTESDVTGSRDEATNEELPSELTTNETLAREFGTPASRKAALQDITNADASEKKGMNLFFPKHILDIQISNFHSLFSNSNEN